MQSHGLERTVTLFFPGNYPDLLIGSGSSTSSFYLYSSVCVLSFPVMSNSATSWIVACQASLSIGLSSQEYWSGFPLPSLGDLPDPGIKPRYQTLWAGSLPSRNLGESYLLWSWRAVFMWGHPCVACMSLMVLMWGLFIVWTHSSAFLSVCWLLLSWRGMIDIAVTTAALYVEWGLPFALWLSHPCPGQSLFPSCWGRSPQVWF